VGGRGSMVRRALGSSSGSTPGQPQPVGSPKTGRAEPALLDAGEDEEEEDVPGSKVLVKLAEQAFASNATTVKQGWLLRRSGKLRVQWRKRYVVLAHGVLYVFRSAFPAVKWKDPQMAMSVIGASCDVSGSPSRFAVRTPETQMVFDSEDEAEAAAWIKAISGAASGYFGTKEF